MDIVAGYDELYLAPTGDHFAQVPKKPRPPACPHNGCAGNLQQKVRRTVVSPGVGLFVEGLHLPTHQLLPRMLSGFMKQ